MAVIVVEGSKVTIYDGDDPSLPMWMVANVLGEDTTNYGFTAIGGQSGGLSSSAALNGKMCFCGGGGYQSQALLAWDFIGDNFGNYAVNSVWSGITAGTLADRNTIQLVTQSLPSIVNFQVNDVAMTVLPDAPTDPATGLPVPTIAVATDGGVSVITDSGAVYDSLDTAPMFRCAFKGSDLVYARASADHLTFIAFANDYSAADGFGDVFGSTSGSFGAVDMLVRPNDIAFDNSEWFFGSKGGATDLAKDGLMSLVLDETNNANSMSSLTTSDYTTGWMPGDIKLAALANSATADRSVNNNPLTQNGTITAAPVATGADVVAYSGFSNNNYLEQPYNDDLDFGEGDFCVMGWFKENSLDSLAYLLSRDTASTAQNFNVYLQSGQLTFKLDDDTSNYLVQVAGASTAGQWQHFVGVKDGDTAYVYINGVSEASLDVSAMGSLTNTSAILRLGRAANSTSPLSNGSLALWRISATAPTADQIAKIYNDERPLFQDSAKATLTGSSDAVTALAHDPDTNLLHVGTSGGRSVFYGLRRINETATAVTTAISAVDGLIVEQ